MISRLNSNLRKMIAVAGGIFLLMTLITRTEKEDYDDEGFQTREFDDIW